MSIIQILQSTALLIGLTALLIGLAAVLYPKFMSKGFGVVTEGKALAYVIGIGVRDIFIGATVLIMYTKSSWASISLVSVFISMVAISDFCVVYKYGDKKKAAVHLCGALISATYALALYYLL